MQRDAKGRFQKGTGGRPRGARNHATMACEALLRDEAKKLTRKAVKLALAGDTVALRLCLERIAPPPRGRLVLVDLPHLAAAEDAPAALASIVGAIGSGQITPTEGRELADLVNAWRDAHQTADLEARIAALEAANANGAP